MRKQLSGFAMLKGLAEPTTAAGEAEDGDSGLEIDEARMERAMSDLEKDMGHLDENNPRHVAHMMKKMKEVLPPGAVPKELDIAIRRLEQGEDPEKVEQDMGEILGSLTGDDQGDLGEEAGGRLGGGGFTRDSGLYDF